jgi:hypothetical protein
MRFRRLRRSRNGNVPEVVELDESDPIEQGVRGSQSSPLLNLPVEIRLEILRSIFSHHIIHFFISRTEEGAQFGWPQGRVKPTKPRIRSKWCSLDCSYRFNDTNELDEPGQGWHHLKLAPGHATGILLSCRQIYHEAIELVYAENVFDFVDLLTFGDFTAQFRPALGRIRYLQTRHKVPTLGHYARFDPPAGLRAAVKVSWDGPAMLLHFVSAVMPQLRQLKLLFERCWMTSEYEAEYSRRHAEWVRYITQLSKCPAVGQPRYIRALGLPWNPQLQALDG